MSISIPFTIPRSNIMFRDNGRLSLKCSEEIAADMMQMYGLDIRNDQRFLRKALNSTNGKFYCRVNPETRDVWY